MWTYGLQLWIQQFQESSSEHWNATKIAVGDLTTHNAPWYVNNEDIYGDPAVASIRQEITKYSERRAKQLPNAKTNWPQS